MTEIITLDAGRPYTGFKSVQITAALDEAARTFDLTMTEAPGEFSFPPGTEVDIRASGTLAARGYVNRYHADGDSRTHNIKIQGRGKGQDFVDSSADIPKGHLKNSTPGDLANQLDKFGVGISIKVPLREVPNQQVRQGETRETCVERYLRPQGAEMMGLADGSIEITNASVAQSVSAKLVEGINIKRFSVDLSDENRFSEYTVKGQNREGVGDENLRIKETINDSGVKRHRPKIIVSETDTDKQRARSRAQQTGPADWRRLRCCHGPEP